MNVLIFGATGMVGHGVVRECLHDPGVQRVQTVGQTPAGAEHAKLREIVRLSSVYASLNTSRYPAQDSRPSGSL